MSDTAGSMLLRAGLVSDADLARAEELRRRGGGTVGAWLVHIGAIDEEGIVEFFHRSLMVPRVYATELERVPRQVVQALPADMATEFRVVPVDIDAEGTLTLAMADPSDAGAADEVGFFTERFCQRAVAAESHIRAAIEKHYGVRIEMPSAFVEMDTPLPPPAPAPHEAAPAAFETKVPAAGEAGVVLLTRVKQLTPAAGAPAALAAGAFPAGPFTVASPLPGASLATPPTPGAPVAGALLARPGAASVPTKGGPAAGAPASGARPPPVPRSELFDISDEADADPPAADARAAIPLTRPIARAPSQKATIQGLPILSFPDPPIARLRAAATRESIAAALVEYMAEMAPRTALLVVRKGTLVGFDGRGTGVDPEAVCAMHIPIAASSLFRDVLQSRMPYRGPLSTAPADRAVARWMGELVGDVLLLPITLRGKVVAVLYGDGITSPLPDAALHAVAREAGAAYERLLLSLKK